MTATTTNHFKWLISVIGGAFVLLQVWGWVENHIKERVTNELKTANSLTALDGSIKDAKTWLDGRANTQDSRIDSIQRELTTLRQEMRENDAAMKARMDAMQSQVK